MNREFSIQSMLLHAKLHQKRLLLLLAASVLVALIAGLLFAGRSGEAPVNEAYQAELEQYKSDQLMLEQSVSYNRDFIDGINQYFAGSLLIQHDLLSQPFYQIEAQVKAPAASLEVIGTRYAGFAKDKALMDSLIPVIALEADESALAELIEVYFDRDTQTLIINTRHPDEAKRQIMAQQVLQYIEAKAEESQIEVTKVGLVKDLQSPLSLKINELVLLRDEAKNQLDQRQKALENLVAPSELLPAANQTPWLKYLVLGILIGLGLSLVYLVYLCGSKKARVLISDLQEYYGLNVLFALRDKRSLLEMKHTLFLDEAKGKEHFANLITLLEQERILVIGKSTLLQEVSNPKLAFVEKLDPEHMAILKQADGVVLSMHPYDIAHTELEQLLSLIKFAGKPILGVVIN